jgi:hypothetical protein
MVLVSFVGGPRDGQHKNYPKNPRVIGCVDEWKAAGIKKGLYKVPKDQTGPFITANWVEL